MGTPEAALLTLAESIADGSAVDWSGAAALDNPEHQAVVRQLRVLAALATLHRTMPADPVALPHALSSRRSAPAPAIGRWAHLDLIERLGGGSFGEVYLAWDRHLEREVALKLLRPSETPDDDLHTSRIVAEGRLLARLHHPNIVTVYGVAVHEGRVGLWMERIHGGTLEQLLHQNGPLSAREAAIVGVELCRALAALHKAGLIHRDIKTQNVMREDGGRIVLMDFGTGRAIDRERPYPLPDLAGTPLYLAPEIFDGAPAGERTDLYSLGVLLYRLTTNAFPVHAATVDALRDAHARHDVVRLRDARPDLPTGFVRIVDRAIASDPEKRYASAGELETDLLDVLDDSRAVREPKLLTDEKPRRLGRWAARAAALVAASAMALVALLALRSRSATSPSVPPGAIRSVVVLPLVNMSGDPTQEYFADGMTDELIGTLGRLGGVNVISRTSAMQFKGSNRPLPEIARTLHVDAVLEGSVVVAPDARVASGARRVRINARLIYAGSDTQLWDRTFETVVTDVVSLQGQVARAVADAIRVRFVSPGMPPQAPKDFEAFDLYLKGRFYWNMRTADGLKQSVEYFKQAIARDQMYAVAYAGLADAYTMLGEYGVIPFADASRLAMSAASHAVSLDDSLAEAHASLGLIHDNRLEFAAAEESFRRALELNPDYATGHHWYAAHLMMRARFADAIAEVERAIALDPLSVSVQGQLAAAYLNSRQYDEAIVQAKRALTINPAFVRAHLFIAEAYAMKHEFDRALAEVEQARSLGSDESQLRVKNACILAAAGRHAEARRAALDLVDRYEKHRQGRSADIAAVYASLGDTRTAFVWLDRASEARDPGLAFLAIDFWFDNLRSDPRFNTLLARLGLSQ